MPKQRREWKLYNEDIERTFTQHQTQITQLDSSITLQASTITNISGKVEEYYSELVVADEGISTEVAKKVGKDTIISTINQSPESVTINASKINLNGFVTFTNLAAYGDHTIALGDGSNTLTIDGSTITGTNLSGWIGYKLRPSALDIYSFTSNNDLVGRISATKSTQMGNSDVGIALFADTGDWLTVGRKNSNGTINGVLWSDPSDGSTYVSKEGATYPALSLQPNLTTLGNSTIPLNLGGSTVNIYESGTAFITANTSGVWVGDSSLPLTLSLASLNVVNNSTYYASLSNGGWSIRGSSGVFAGPITGTSKRGFRFDSSDVYVYNDTSNSTYIVLHGNNIDLYAQSGKIQLYSADNHSLYLGSSGLMYDGKYVRVESTKSAANQS